MEERKTHLHTPILRWSEKLITKTKNSDLKKSDYFQSEGKTEFKSHTNWIKFFVGHKNLIPYILCFRSVFNFICHCITILKTENIKNQELDIRKKILAIKKLVNKGNKRNESRNAVKDFKREA